MFIRSSMSASAYMHQRQYFKFTWKVENPFFNHETKSIQSPTVTMHETEASKWYLWMCYENESENSVTVTLKLFRQPASNDPKDVVMDYMLALEVDGKVEKMLEEKQRKFLRVFNSDPQLFYQVDHFSVSLPARTNFLQFVFKAQKRLEEFSENLYCLARTCIGVQKREFMWKVANFSALKPKKKERYYIKSLSTDENEVVLDLFLTRDGTIEFAGALINREIKYCDLSLSIVDGFGKTIYAVKEIFSDRLEMKELPKPIIKAKLMENGCRDVLSIRCSCFLCFGIVWEGIEAISFESAIQERNSFDLQTME